MLSQQFSPLQNIIALIYLVCKENHVLSIDLASSDTYVSSTNLAYSTSPAFKTIITCTRLAERNFDFPICIDSISKLRLSNKNRAPPKKKVTFPSLSSPQNNPLQIIPTDVSLLFFLEVSDLPEIILNRQFSHHK